MDLKNIIGDRLSHHSYLFLGDLSLKDDFFYFLENNIGFKTKANPNFYIYEKNFLGVDDVRVLGERHSKKSFKVDGQDKNIFFLIFNSTTEEAQNAFLKILEEPNPNTHFLILAPQNIFLKTFLSRVFFVDLSLNKKYSDFKISKDLVSNLDYVLKLSKDISDEKKTKQYAIDFISFLEKDILEKEGVKNGFKKLNVLEKARKMLFQKGAMTKMILENVILHL